MQAMRERFGLPVGYSDHTTELLTGALAVAAGACVIEKHLTYDRRASGPDHAASFDAQHFRHYVRLIRQAESMTGPVCKVVEQSEQEVRRISRQSVCAVRDLPASHVLRREDLTVKRPGTGVPAARLDDLIGRPLVRAVKANDLLVDGDVDWAEVQGAG
jgi:sialic acid synthase SpsE